MFDREFEWSELVRFSAADIPRATLGVVSGRRRQGKTYLLDALVRAGGGFLYTATETTATDALRQFGAALGRYRQEPSPFRFADWDEALAQVMRIPGGPATVVIDEFPFLARASPELPSVIQRYLDPTAQRSNSAVRLLLCGSALSFMGGLLSGSAPLRGRAGLELVVHTLDFRLAAQFWEIEDPVTAVQVNAIVGGTPAYRREFTQGDSPAGPDDFASWVVRAVLNPARPLFREARYLLAEEPELREVALYHSVLAAIAEGNTTRGGIASYLGRRSTDLAHPLGVLADAGLISHGPDMFRRNRSAYRIAEPLVTFYHAVMRPAWGNLERPGRAGQVWQRAAETYTSKVLGPHFEQICRDWVRLYAEPQTFGGDIAQVGSGTVTDPRARETHEVDVAVIGHDDRGSPVVRCIGEAKWNTCVTAGHLNRLAKIKEVLRHQRIPATDGTRLALFSAAGFTDEVRGLASISPEVVLVDLPRLYHGE
jgi:uncharacterized protein